MPTIVGLFSNGIDVERVLFDLEDSGFSDIDVIDHEKELAALPATGSWIGLDDDDTVNTETLQQDVEMLQQLGVADAQAYAEYVQQGQKLVIVRADGEHVREILDILCSANAHLEPITELM